jgi:serine protease Do
MKPFLKLAFFALTLPLGFPALAVADKLLITSTPAGATVEIDGAPAGTTPFEKDFPGGYFHKTKTALGARLEHPMTLRLTLAGYATRDLQITEGPMNWRSLKGHDYGEYWLLKTNHVHVDLVPISHAFTGRVTADLGANGVVGFQPKLTLEDLVARSKPAVVHLAGPQKSGTGFFVTDTGLIATNAHLARGEESLVTRLSGGEQLEAKVVYVDAELDIALAKVEGSGFPHLMLADDSTVRQGESVLAIGNPGDAMPFSVTKGIVSAVGKLASAGPGTWIQTDAPINPGNSGGPLLNARGEVIGINTQKVVKKDVGGIGFALSATDLLEVLSRFYPTEEAVPEKLAAPSVADEPVQGSSRARGEGMVVVSEPEGADIWVDDKFVGSAPAQLKLSSGNHLFVVKLRGHADWIRRMDVLAGSQVSLNPDSE